MTNESGQSQLRFPESLDQQLKEYRGHVRSIKMLESAGMAILAILVGFLAVFLVDRVLDVSAWFRWLVFAIAVIGVSTVPVWFERWVLRYQSHASLARLISKKLPQFGDSLLGAIELSANPNEQSRSPALCRAALEQVAADASQRDLRSAAPDAYHRRWWTMASGALVILALVATLYPAAAWNAWQRFAFPWADVPRFTFAQTESLPDPWVVPHGEPLSLDVELAPTSMWSPSAAALSIGTLPSIPTALTENKYHFEIPPQIESTRMRIKIGDASPTVAVEPMLRPQLSELKANVILPEYLQRSEPVVVDARSGSLVAVANAKIQLQGKINRDVDEVTLDNERLQHRNNEFEHPGIPVADTQSHEIRWRDTHGLTGKIPFPLQIQSHPDEPPSVFADGLPRSKVVLDSEQLRFQVRSSDDFGVQHVGMEWRTAEGASTSNPVHGEWKLVSGGPNAETLDAEAVFQATAFNIPSQPIELRLFTEDYFPNRGRIYSAPVILYVLNASDHAVWVLQQLNRWQREALEVRDRELQLLETNRKLRELSPEDLTKEEVRNQIEQQAAAEQANARRLSSLNQKGEDLIRQAARNSEIGVGHLEKWAEMQRILKDIAASRMPSVADLLKQSAKSAKAAASSSQAKSAKIAGSNRNDSEGTPSQESQDPKQPTPPAAPRVVDQESSQQPTDTTSTEGDAKKKPSSGALRLPTTTLAGNGKSNGEQPPPPPADESMKQAVEAQLALLEEFDKVAEELNKIMANLEGSTLVKRFKAAAREQLSVADTTTQSLPNTFGQRAKRIKGEERSTLEALSSREMTAVNSVGQIIDDLEAFHERRPMVKFRDVLEDIRREDPLGGLRSLSAQVLEQQGIAIADAEYWSDTFDRWAEDLVDPACQGKCPGGKSKSSLPPSIVLEVMQILEAEMNLRDRTRVVEQAREADTKERYAEAAKELTETQSQLRDRVEAVGERILELPNAQEEFAKEISLMAQVDQVMQDAVRILSQPDTGRAAIAAETEAIELLLQSKRINPKSGGGGG
ncbi:MAG: hypothetical protein MUF23_10020, partial [Pirellula sp.]|nr:hypothetical protein [Pirellula sp.]